MNQLTNEQLDFMSREQNNHQKRLLRKLNILHIEDEFHKMTTATLVNLCEILKNLRLYQYWNNNREYDRIQMLQRYVIFLESIFSLINSCYDMNYLTNFRFLYSNMDMLRLGVYCCGQITKLGIDRFTPEKCASTSDSIINETLNIGYKLGFNKDEIFGVFLELIGRSSS